MKKNQTDKERIAHLEAQIKQLKSDIEDLEIMRLSEIEDRLEDLEKLIKKSR
jgi:hypothetical protein